MGAPTKKEVQPLAVRQPDTDTPLRELMTRYDLRQTDVARHAGVTTFAFHSAMDREQLRGLGPETRKRYLAAIEKARRDVMRRVAV